MVVVGAAVGVVVVVAAAGAALVVVVVVLSISGRGTREPVTGSAAPRGTHAKTKGSTPSLVVNTLTRER